MKHKKILICDDDQGILEMLEFMMEDFGYRVMTETNSLNVLKDLEELKPDLLLLDIWMPVLSGDQILKNIKTNPMYADLPVIMYSASSEGSAIATEAGADDFIAKPFNLNELLHKIEQLLN